MPPASELLKARPSAAAAFKAAIRSGAPLYNKGDRASCMWLYLGTLEHVRDRCAEAAGHDDEARRLAEQAAQLIAKVGEPPEAAGAETAHAQPRCPAAEARPSASGNGAKERAWALRAFFDAFLGKGGEGPTVLELPTMRAVYTARPTVKKAIVAALAATVGLGEPARARLLLRAAEEIAARCDPREAGSMRDRLLAAVGEAAALGDAAARVAALRGAFDGVVDHLTDRSGGAPPDVALLSRMPSSSFGSGV